MLDDLGEAGAVPGRGGFVQPVVAAVAELTLGVLAPAPRGPVGAGGAGVVFAMINGTVVKYRIAVCSLLATLTVILMVSQASSSQFNHTLHQHHACSFMHHQCADTDSNVGRYHAGQRQ